MALLTARDERSGDSEGSTTGRPMFTSGWLNGSGLDRGQCDRVDDVVDQGAAAEVIHRPGQTLQHRADADDLGAALDRLVGRVAGVQVGEDEHGGLASYRAAGPFGLPDRADGGGVVLE